MGKKKIEKVSLDALNQSINAQISGALSMTPETSTKLTEVKTAKNAVATATYELVNPIGKKSEYLITDGGLIRSIEIIKRAMWIQRVVGYATCREFARIEDSGKLEEMGISKISEFGKAFFGLEPSTVNHYTRIGRQFIEDIVDENGAVTGYKVKDGLPMLSISHFVELNAYVEKHGVDAVIELYLNGELTDGMPVKKLRERIKELENTVALPESSASVSDADTDENGESVTHDIETSSPSETSTASETSEEHEGQVNSNIVLAHIMEALNVIRSNAALLGWNEEWYMPQITDISHNAETFLASLDSIE